jgi:hypothetical protein
MLRIPGIMEMSITLTRRKDKKCIYGGGELSKHCPNRVKEMQVAAE